MNNFGANVHGLRPGLRGLGPGVRGLVLGVRGSGYYTALQRHRFREGWNKTNAVLPALSFHLMPASEIHQRYITTPFDDLSQPFWCKRRAIVVQGRMQPVVHRPRGTRDVVVSRCSRPFVAGCRRVQRLTICGGGLDLAGCTQVAYREWTASGQVSRIGVMIAGNSGRPGGSIYKPWFSSPQQRLQGVHPGHRTQEESILSSWLVGSERIAPHISLAENVIQFPRQTYENMEDRFLRCLHRKWGMVENDVKAFKGFIDEDGRPITDPSRWPDDVRQRWLATMQGVDYVNTQHAGDYEEAWTLPDADLCVDEGDGGPSGWRVFKLDKIVRTTLIFVAGPNASNGWGHSMMGSVLRTRNKRCIDEASSTSNVELRRTASGLEVNNIEKAAPFFVSCVRNAMRAGLDAAIEAGIDLLCWRVFRAGSTLVLGIAQ